MKEIELTIKTTTRIEATVNGKKKILRRFDIPVAISPKIAEHLRSYADDVAKEVVCDSRTPEEWVEFIESLPVELEMKGWLASVVWFHFGGEEEDSLRNYYKSFGKHLPAGDINKVLEEYGFSKKVNQYALLREKAREERLEQLIEEVKNDL